VNKPYSIQTGCKINLGLNVVERRPDGYHNLQTIFYPVPLYDELTIREKDSLIMDGEDTLTLGGNPLEGEVWDNLVLRAVRLLRQEGFPIPPLNIDLRKVIPSGAGLGGGSSDAACMVTSLTRLYGLPLSEEQMERLVSKLGADCPFFINPRPLYAEGIGDVFTPISLDLSGWYLMLVKPEVHVSTREAYAGVHPHQPAYSLLDVVKQPVGAWASRMVNDFEESIFFNHPLLSEIKEELYRQGAAYASMSGSGSTIFGLFRSRPNCEEHFAGHFTFVCQL
jgi:4-diphosphocytidyl-2-C-methyl-D-erythritol kinase